MRPHRRDRAAQLWLVGLAFASVFGCAAPLVDSSANDDELSPGQKIERLLGSDNGLETRQWIVLDRTDHIATAIRTYAIDDAVDRETSAALRRNGLRLVRVPLEQFDELAAAIGPPTLDANTWHGQVFEWRELLRHSTGSSSIAIAADGRVGRYESGSFRLLMRAWTVLMEDGPILHLQLLPQFDEHRSHAYTGLIAAAPPRGRVFESFALTLDLHVGSGYLLTYESPETIWWPSEAAGPVDAEQSTPDTYDRRGPSAIGPATFGELLFVTPSRQATRRVLVFIPKIPERMFPLDALAETSADSTSDGNADEPH